MEKIITVTQEKVMNWDITFPLHESFTHLNINTQRNISAFQLFNSRYIFISFLISGQDYQGQDYVAEDATKNFVEKTTKIVVKIAKKCSAMDYEAEECARRDAKKATKKAGLNLAKTLGKTTIGKYDLKFGFLNKN